MNSRHVPTISIILLTHATPSHIAAFAHCCKHFPLFLQIPTYATTPVISLGRTLLQDIYAAAPQASTVIPGSSLGESSLGLSTPSDTKPQILLQPPTAVEITSYFDRINPLRYSQPHEPLPSPFSPPLNGLSITAYNAGHSLGGTIWHIQHGMESVVYAVDWNLARENVFGGASWLGGGLGGGSEVIEQLRKPTALVCSSKGVESTPQAASRTKRDELLLDMVRSSLSRGGTVLIPSDSSARVLEIAWLLEGAWRRSVDDSDHVLKDSKLYLASRTIGSTLESARSMIEWMDENVTKSFEAESENKRGHRRGDSKRTNDLNKADGDGGDRTSSPFNFRFLRMVQRKSRIEKILSTRHPKVIIASDASLDWGFSKDVLKRMADDPNNLIILTEDYGQVEEPSSLLGKTLWQWYQAKEHGIAVESGKSGQSLDQVYTGGQDLVVNDYSRAQLVDKELALYQQYLATQKQLQSIQTSGIATLENTNDAIEDADSSSSSSSDESDDERQGKSLNFSARMLSGGRNKATEDKDLQGINALLRKPGCYDWDVRGKKGREAVFPYVSKRKRLDEFGELIRPEDYLRAEERDEIDGRDTRDNPDGKKSGLGEKRKWGEATFMNGKMSRRRSSGTRKRQKLNKSGAPNHNGRNEIVESSSDESESEIEDISTGPSKLITTTSIIQANLRLAYVDFSGLHDQRSLSMLIPLIQPRRVVLTGGTESETKWLADECRQKLGISTQTSDGSYDILTPAIGETVTASMDTYAWTVKLSRELVKRIQWQDVRGLGVVTLMGKLTPTPSSDLHIEEQARKRQKTGSDESIPEEAARVGDEVPPTLDVLPANQAAATRTATQPLHVGDLRLADLRRMLQSTGHTAEFRGEGTLVIDNLVAVRKTASGQIEVESSGMSLPNYLVQGRESSFQTVKRRIYEGLAVIAGG